MSGASSPGPLSSRCRGGVGRPARAVKVLDGVPGEPERPLRVPPCGRRREGLLEAIEVTLGTFSGSVLAYDDAAARHYARLLEPRRCAGHPLAVEDGMIAAICVARGKTLATRNTSDLAGLGLDLIDPWAASS